MKKLFLTINKITLTIAVLIVFTSNIKAQDCPTTLTSKSGKVYSAAPGILKATSASDQVTVYVKKTDGKAETQVNIYVGGQYKGKIEFDNGNYTTQYRSKTVIGAKNKEVKVEIVNQSVANTFSYTAKIDGSRKSLVTSGSRVTGTLFGQTKKTIETIPSCTGKAKIIVKRDGAGIARGTIRVWEKQGNSWVAMNQHNKTLEQNENSKIYTINSNKAIKVELKNISVGNTLKYIMNVMAAN